MGARRGPQGAGCKGGKAKARRTWREGRREGRNLFMSSSPHSFFMFANHEDDARIMYNQHLQTIVLNK